MKEIQKVLVSQNYDISNSGKINNPVEIHSSKDEISDPSMSWSINAALIEGKYHLGYTMDFGEYYCNCPCSLDSPIQSYDELILTLKAGLLGHLKKADLNRAQHKFLASIFKHINLYITLKFN